MALVYKDHFVERAATLWMMYSTMGPFQGEPVPDLQKAGMDYDSFKRHTQRLSIALADKYERPSK
jgi:hypothetical protein